MFGNGQTTTTNRQTNLGGLPAIVCEDRNLQEDLISVNPLLDAGYRLTMEGNHGTLTKDEAGSSISVVREGARWSVDLRNTEPSSNDYSNIRDTVEAYAVINADSKSLRLRVISLHERLGHANTEAMCDAVGGEDPSWTHCDLTPAQIRRVSQVELRGSVTLHSKLGYSRLHYKAL